MPPNVRNQPRPTAVAGMSSRITDHLIGAAEDGLWNGQAELLGRLEIDDQLELRGLLDRYAFGLPATSIP